jgi:hypothetical protein
VIGNWIMGCDESARLNKRSVIGLEQFNWQFPELPIRRLSFFF